MHYPLVPLLRHPDGVLVIDVPVSGAHYGCLHWSAQAFGQESCIGDTLLGKALQLLYLHHAKSPLHLGHAQVVTQPHVMVAFCLSMVAQETHALSDARIIGGDHATFAGRNVLGGVE